MGASFIVLTCNTAHYFYDHFQSLTPVPILHMPRGAVAHMAGQYPKERFHRVGFLGTMGSRASGVYRQAVEEAGYTFVEPDDELQERITSLIYDDVKGTGDLNLQRYESVLQAMLDPAGHVPLRYANARLHRALRAQRGVPAASAADHRRPGRPRGGHRQPGQGHPPLESAQAKKVGRAEQQPHPRMHDHPQSTYGHPQSDYGRQPPPAVGNR